jgi:hypothetical protein
MKNKALGFYLAAAVAVLSLVGVIVYGSVLVQDSIVTVLMIAAVVLAAATAVLGKLIDNNWIVALIPVVNSAVITLAIGAAFLPMVDQIAYVITALDPFSTIASLVIFAVVAVIALVANVVSCFVSHEK